MFNNSLQLHDEENRYRAFLIFFIIYCFGKSYYVIFGWHGHLVPDAPLAVILLKDFLLIGFTIFIFLTYSDIWPDFKDKFTRYFAFFCLYLLLIIFMHYFNLELADWGRFYLRNSFMPLVFIYFGYKLIPKNRYLHFLNAFLAYAVINALVATISYFYYFIILDTVGEPFLYLERTIALTDSPNTLGGVITIGILIAISQLFNRLGKVYILSYSLLILAVGLYLSHSLSNIIVLAALILLSMVFHIRRKIGKDIYFILFCFVIGALFTAIFYASMNKRFGGVVEGSTLPSISLRKTQHTDVSSYLKKSDLADILFGNFKTEKYQRYDSTYLTIFYSFGTITFLVASAFMVYLLRFAFISRRMAKTDYDKTVLEILYMTLILFIIVSFGRDLFHRFPLNNFFYVEAGMLVKYIKDLNLSAKSQHNRTTALQEF